ncbi:MAG: OmpA family protein, partial [Prevotella histicola]|uniref:OmpA family protein n=1 Tax=Prevotella histicola TaxID=470565 RepID=UPI001CABC856
VTPRDQAEIDALNAQINELRNRKPEVITKEVVKEVPAIKELSVSDLVFVTFAQGKSNLTREAKAALNNVKEGSHVQVVGTASPEGSKEINDRLSQARADVVANYLKSRGVNIDEATGKGVQGVTSNRLAVVYVK